MNQKQARRFENGLNLEIKKHVKISRHATLVEVVQAVQIVEQDIRQAIVKEQPKNPPQGKHWDRNDKRKFDTTSNFHKKPKNETSFRLEHPTCNTGGKKHIGVCFKNSKACFNCGKTQHYI